jgi:hypothetical protein
MYATDEGCSADWLLTHVSDVQAPRLTDRDNSCFFLSLSLSVALVRVRIISAERPPFVGEVTAERVIEVSATDPNGRILGFLDRSRYFFFHVAPQLYSRG